MTDTSTSPKNSQTPRATADAETLARQAINDVQPDSVGELLGTKPEGEGSLTFKFAAHVRGYRGWEWHVVISGEDSAPTLSEVALIPGDDALLAPAWIPWKERLQPGDLGDNDVLPVDEDDPRLVPGYVDSGDDELDEAVMPIGYGRERVLSAAGRDATAARWTKGEFGPRSNRAKKAPAHCASCGFYLPLAGALKASFGVCANELSADGHVVHAEYGCGAHSSVKPDYSETEPADMYFDDSEYEIVARRDKKDSKKDSKKGKKSAKKSTKDSQ